MRMFDMKRLSKEDLLELIENKQFENKELEYKDYSFPGGKLTDRHKDKLMKEIAAFANTNGGTIIIGMKEDENRLPVELSGAGISFKEFDNWQSSFRQMVLSRIRPHLHGIECIPVPIDDTSIAIVIYVPQSYARPHSFWDGNKDEFLIRYANGISYMDIDDLRNGFLYTYGLQDKIRQFKRDRISQILANECVGDLGTDAKLVFHIIPEWSFSIGNVVDLKLLNKNSGFRPISSSSWKGRFNADGYCIYSSDKNSIDTYTQVFHNGIIEAVEIRLVSKYKDKQVYDWTAIEAEVLKTFIGYGDFLESFGVPKPWHVSAALLNAKGYVTVGGWGNYSDPIERSIVNSQEGICTEELSLKMAMKPVFDSLSNAFGYSGSGVITSE